jgi:hypothetical protein
MPCYINIEDRYRCASLRERQMLHAWVATAAVVVGVGATAASSAMAADKQKKAAGRAAKAQDRQTAEMKRQAEEITPERRAEAMEAFLPGAEQQRVKASEIANQMLSGQLPKDVQDQIMRSIAEYAGAGFNPFTAGSAGGFQVAQGIVPRQFGQTAMDYQIKGQELALSWQALAGNFVNQVGTERLQANALANEAANRSIATRYAANAAPSGFTAGLGAAGSGLMQAGGAYLGGMGGGGSGGGGAGGYATMGQAQQAAPYAQSISSVYGTGYVPRATAV